MWFVVPCVFFQSPTSKCTTVDYAIRMLVVFAAREIDACVLGTLDVSGKFLEI